jgi:energy-coupling factor transporter ATP-binding protein EcfA2
MGEILFEGRPLDGIGQREQSERIGFVQQSPENQIVTDKVWHELAFGLESLGYDTATIRGRVAEMASFFGIQTWFYKNVTELSGGQKQLLNLASVMAMQPSVLILDEPTSQLDPIAASDFLATVGKINRELGTTVLMTEHRLEEVFPMSDRVLVMDGGRILADGTPREVGARLRSAGHAMFLAMPTAMRVWAAVPNGAPCPVTVREGRDWLAEFSASRELKKLPEAPASARRTRRPWSSRTSGSSTARTCRTW